MLIVSLTLIAIAVMAYRRSGSRRMLVLGSVFVLFLVKALMGTLVLFFDIASIYTLMIVGGSIDSAALIILYLSTLKV